MLSPCLHPLPTELLNDETRMRHRYVNFLINPETAHVLRLRASIIEYLRSYFIKDGQVEVQTPILAEEAGGAAARPFRTSATEFPERQLSLRIAPELWLKRLVIGGFDRVFEIGPSFRNEGIHGFLCFIAMANTVKGWIPPTILNLPRVNFTEHTPI